MGKTIDEKELEIQEINKLKVQLDLANNEIQKIKKDMELLKRAININNKDIKDADLKALEDNKSGLEFVIEDEKKEDGIKDEKINTQNNEIIEFELNKEEEEKSEKLTDITVEEIDSEIQLSLKKISGEIERELENIANEIVKEDDEKAELKDEEGKNLKKQLEDKNQYIENNLLEDTENDNLNEENELKINLDEDLHKNKTTNSKDTIESVEEIIGQIESKMNEEANKESLSLLKNIKNSFIENNNYECIIALNKFMDNIKHIEKYLTSKDIIMLMYLGYFYEKLNNLLEKSKKVNEFYISENEESKLLRFIILEKGFPINKDANSCVEEMLNNKNLFNSLETMVKGNIIERIHNIAYKKFDEVFSIKDIVHGEDIINIKAWVKKKDKLGWKLVEGLYSNGTNKLYMLESAISILNLNYNKERIVSNNLESNVSVKSIKKAEVKEKNSTENIKLDNDPLVKNIEIEENNKNQSNINNTCKIDKNKILKEVKEKVKEENIGDDENDYGWRNLKNKIFSKFKRSDKE